MHQEWRRKECSKKGRVLDVIQRVGLRAEAGATWLVDTFSTKTRWGFSNRKWLVVLSLLLCVLLYTVHVYNSPCGNCAGGCIFDDAQELEAI